MPSVHRAGNILKQLAFTAGASPPPVLAFEQGLSVGSANITAAGVGPTTIFLNAENQTDSPNPWSVPAGAWLQVHPEFVPA